MPSILLFPLLPFIIEVGLVVYWVPVTAILYSAGVPTPHWRDASEYQPMGLQQLMLASNITVTSPPKPVPDTTNMTRDVSRLS
jgi:choline transporter-like protein 2/4/5